VTAATLRTPVGNPTGADRPAPEEAVPTAEVGCPALEEAVLEVECPALEPLTPEPAEPCWLAPEPVLAVPELEAAARSPEATRAAAEVTGDAAACTADPTAEAGDDAACPETGGSASCVAACACRENTSMTRKIPAATTASCTARRAMRRAIVCGITSSDRLEGRKPGT
jgi:hypothetical protein